MKIGRQVSSMAQLSYALRNDLPLPAWLHRHPRKRRLLMLAWSYPPWVKASDVQLLYNKAHILTGLTGVKYVVDHIVPVSHPYVCGLTVPWNLQVITEAQNVTKANNVPCDDQLRLRFELTE